MSSPFPLLRLPRLVLCEVFKCLSIGEKFKLSLCSKKVSTQINNCRLYSQKVTAVLSIIYKEIEIYSENDKDSFKIFIYPESWKTLCSNTQYFSIPSYSSKDETEFHTFWKNHKEGFLTTIQNLLKMFQCKISTTIDRHNCEIYQQIISELYDLQGVEFKILAIEYFDLKGLKDENLLWNQISSNLGLVEVFCISRLFEPDFTPVFTSWPQKIDIGSSAWFTLEYLLACPCTTITLWGSYLGNKDLDEVFKKWKAGGFPNLERMRIHSFDIIPYEATILEMRLSQLDGKVIQTDDGSKKATIKTGLASIELSVTPFE